MNLRQLKYFKVVAEELHFRKAAERLFISQPPLSRQIRELEEQLGTSLFHRSNKRVTLTEAGQHFLEHTERILQEIESAKITLQQLKETESGQLRIGYTGSTFHDKLTQVLKEIHIAFPMVKTRLYEQPTIRLVEALEKGEIDVCIVRAPIHSTSLHIHTLYNEPFSFIVAKDSVTDKSIELKDFKNEPFIFFNKEYASSYYSTLIAICQRAGFTPDVAHEANNIQSILKLVANGLGVSIVPSTLQKQYKELPLIFTPLSDSPHQTEVVIAYKRGNKRLPVTRFTDMMCKLHQ